MEKETVLLLLLLLLLKPMTKTSQLKDMAIIICHDGCPMLKISIPCFFHHFDENHMKDMQMKKEILLLLKPMTKTSQLIDVAVKSKKDVFRCVTQSQMAVQGWQLEGVFTWTVSICWNCRFHAKLGKILIKRFELSSSW